MEGMIYNSFATLWEQADYAVGSLEISPRIVIQGTALSPDEKAAKRVEGTVKGLLALGKSFLPMAKQLTAQIDAADPNKPGEKLYAEAEKLLNSATVKLTGSTVSLNISSSEQLPGMIVETIEPAIKMARKQAAAMLGINNLRQVGLAMHNYLSTHNAFPPAVLLGPDGKTPHSWRVAILPYIEQDALYKMYNLNEPWDSENNKKVLAQMPSVYRAGNAPAGSTNASVFVLTGEGGIFTATPSATATGAKINSITDGTSNTILAVEAERDIPWTKPEDIPVTQGQVPQLGMKDAPSFNAVFADGAAYKLDSKLKAELFYALFGMRDGTLVNLEDVLVTVPGAPGAGAPPGFSRPKVIAPPLRALPEDPVRPKSEARPK
jgi:hypothetical protein